MTPTRTNDSDPAARAVGRRVLKIEAEAVASLVERLDERFDRAVELLGDCRGRVIVTGMGKSGLVCQKIAATLAATGRPAHFMHPAEALHGDLGMIVEGDVLLAISNSGETDEIVRLLERVRRLGVPIVSLTGVPRSTLARYGDVHVDIGVHREADEFGIVPTASTTAAMAMGDALALACLMRRGLTREDLARYHPGGRIGRRLLAVSTLMHAGDDVPRIRENASLRDAVAEVSRKGLGMTCVVDHEDRLVGVLTDGDLRRHVLAEAAPLAGGVGESMTRKPQTIGPDALAADALHTMEERKITSLPVIDSQSRLLGVIQIHDLWRTELF